MEEVVSSEAAAGDEISEVEEVAEEPVCRKQDADAEAAVAGQRQREPSIQQGPVVLRQELVAARPQVVCRQPLVLAVLPLQQQRR